MIDDFIRKVIFKMQTSEVETVNVISRTFSSQMFDCQ